APIHTAEIVNPQYQFTASSSGHSFGFTQEQYQKILELIQQIPSPHLPQQINANAVVTTNLSSTNFSGFHSCFNSLSSHIVSRIVDTGATDHICCSLSLFSSYTAVQNVFVTLPNGQQVPITHVGTVPISHSLVVHSVLFAPSFSVNLLSITQLTQKSHC